MDQFEYWKDLLADETLDKLSENQLADLYQMGLDAQILAATPMFRFLLSSVKDHYISAIASDQNDSVDALRSIRAGIRNIDVLTDQLVHVDYLAERAKERFEKIQADRAEAEAEGKNKRKR